MYTTDERMKLVMQRAKAMGRKAENRRISGLTALSGALSFGLFAVLAMTVTKTYGTVQGLYGSVLLYEDAGGYVLVGLFAFAAAVGITLLCIRYREKTKGKSKQEEEQTR